MSTTVSAALLATTMLFAAGCLDEPEAEVETSTTSSAVTGAAGGYLIKTANNLCLDVAGASADNWARVVQWGCHNSANQQWIVTYMSPGWFTLRNQHSQKCLTLPTATGGEKLYQLDCTGAANQQWYSANSVLYSGSNTNLVMDVPSNSAGWGAQIQVWGRNGSPAQQFRFESACGGFGVGGYMWPGDSIPSCNGRFRLHLQATDGNLVYRYENGPVVWASGARGAYATAQMQGDGNFVVYGNSVWSTGTSGHGGAWLAAQGDGNVVVYPPGGGPALWWANNGGM